MLVRAKHGCRSPERSGLWAMMLSVAFMGCGASPAPAESTRTASAVPPRPVGVDVHMHVGPAVPGQGESSGAAALAALDEAGLARGVLLSPGYRRAPGCADDPCEAQRLFTQAMNDWALAERLVAPSRLWVFCGVPWESGWTSAEVARCAEAGAAGLKMHQVSADVSLRDESPRAALGAILDAAATSHLPVLIHVQMQDADEVRALFELARDHPAAVVIAAHQIAPNLALLREAPDNLWIEVSGLTHVPVEAAPHFVESWRQLGIHRVLLGSDFPSLSPRDHVAWLEAAPLSERERRAIMGENAERLLSRPEAR